MSNQKNKPRKKSVDLQRSPFLTVEDWRNFLGSVFSGEDKRDDADMFARYVFLLSNAIDQRELQLAKASLGSAMIAAKELGRFAQIELEHYKTYLLGDLEPERELQFRTATLDSGNGNGAHPRPIKKKH
jgi:hypothetical protein